MSLGQLSLPTACPYISVGCANALPDRRHILMDPLSGARRAFAGATYRQGHTETPGTRYVPWSWSRPHCCGQGSWGEDCASILGGRSLWEKTGICLCSAMQNWYLCPLQSTGHCLAGHCLAGIVLMLCGQVWPDNWVGRTPLRSQRCRRSVPHSLKVSTDQAQERAEYRKEFPKPLP